MKVICRGQKSHARKDWFKSSRHFYLRIDTLPGTRPCGPVPKGPRITGGYSGKLAFLPRTEIEILFCRRLHAMAYQHCSSYTRPIATIRGPTESSAAVLSIWGGKRPAQGRRLGRNRVRSQRVANQTSRRRRPSRYGQLRLFSDSREVLLPSLTPKLGSHGFYHEPIRSQKQAKSLQNYDCVTYPTALST